MLSHEDPPPQTRASRMGTRSRSLTLLDKEKQKGKRDDVEKDTEKDARDGCVGKFQWSGPMNSRALQAHINSRVRSRSL